MGGAVHLGWGGREEGGGRGGRERGREEGGREGRMSRVKIGMRRK